MNIGDSVKHRKHGRGKIVGFTDYGSRGRYARVEFESGNTQLLTESRLVPDVVANYKEFDPSTLAPTRKDKGLDYALLERAKQHVSAEHPDADDVKAFPYLVVGKAYCEVWKNKAATIVIYTEDQPVRKRKSAA